MVGALGVGIATTRGRVERLAWPNAATETTPIISERIANLFIAKLLRFRTDTLGKAPIWISKLLEALLGIFVGKVWSSRFIVLPRLRWQDRETGVGPS